MNTELACILSLVSSTWGEKIPLHVFIKVDFVLAPCLHCQTCQEENKSSLQNMHWTFFLMVLKITKIIFEFKKKRLIVRAILLCTQGIYRTEPSGVTWVGVTGCGSPHISGLILKTK